MIKLLLATAAALLLSSAGAYAATTLPGGASSLTEAHDDWTVRCQVAAGVVNCAAQQEQLQAQSKQRVIAIEIVPGGDVLQGTLVLPFGLQLSVGAVIAVDARLTSPPQPFQTCLPAGCLVPLSIGKDWEAAMRTSTALAISAKAVDGQDAKFSISLKGFSSALDRIVELTK